MKKIMFCAYNLSIGGIEKSLVNLLKKISYDYDITLLLQHQSGELLKEIPENIKIIDYNLSTNKNILLRKIINRIKLFKFIIKYRNKFDKSICYATYDYVSSIITKYTSKNNILWVHTNYLNLFSKDIEKFKEFFNKRKINKYSKIIIVSNDASEDFVKIFPQLKSKTLVINNLINSEEIMKKSETEKIIRSKNKLVTYVGRLEEDSKGLYLLLDVAKEMQTVDFWIIGDGPDKINYKNYLDTNKNNNVKLLGQKENPYPYIKNTDLLILPSVYEGLPVVLLEGLVLNQKILSTIDLSKDLNSKKYIFLTTRDKNNMKDDIIKVLKNNKLESFDVKNYNKNNLDKIHKILEEK